MLLLARQLPHLLEADPRVESSGFKECEAELEVTLEGSAEVVGEVRARQQLENMFAVFLAGWQVMTAHHELVDFLADAAGTRFAGWDLPEEGRGNAGHL